MTQFEQFTTDLRRVLYLQQILRYSQEGLRTNPLTPPWMKAHINNSHNQMKAMRNDLMVRGKADTWDTICDDLNSDRLHDLALHLDFIAPVVNIAEITDILQEHSKPQQDELQ